MTCCGINCTNRASKESPLHFFRLVKPTITNLGVVLDPEMRMDSHISQVVRSCFSRLRQLPKMKSILKDVSYFLPKLDLTVMYRSKIV